MGIRLITIITILPILAIVVFIAIKGMPAISWEFLRIRDYGTLLVGDKKHILHALAARESLSRHLGQLVSTTPNAQNLK